MCVHANFEKSHPTVGGACGAGAVQEEMSSFIVRCEPRCRDAGGGTARRAGAVEPKGPHPLSHGLTCPEKAPGFPAPESQIHIKPMHQ